MSNSYNHVPDIDSTSINLALVLDMHDFDTKAHLYKFGVIFSIKYN